MFGKNLSYYYRKHKAFSLQTSLQIGIQLISLMEQFHSIGCIYNDLKLDNICVGDFSDDKKCDLKLIDFGLTTSYATAKSVYQEP